MTYDCASPWHTEPDHYCYGYIIGDEFGYPWVGIGRWPDGDFELIEVTAENEVEALAYVMTILETDYEPGWRVTFLEREVID